MLQFRKSRVSELQNVPNCKGGVACGKSNIFSSNRKYNLQSLIRAELSFCSFNVPEIVNDMNQNHSIFMLGNAHN